MHVGCLHIPAFSAWAFERTASDGRAAPVVVFASGRVIAASRPLRATIAEGMLVGRAERLMPEGALLRQQNISLEEAAWENVLQELYACTPCLEPQGVGRVFFKPFEGLRALVSELRAQVGIAEHRSTALLGALRAAPGNGITIRSRHVRAFLDRFDMEGLMDIRGYEVPADVPAFSEEIVEQLPLFGLDTLGSVYGLAQRHLKAQFGVEGERLYRMLHPTDTDPVATYQPPRTICRAYEFDLPRPEPGEMLCALEFMLKQAAEDLERCGTQRVTVTLHDALRPSCVASRVLPEPSNDIRRLFGTVKTLLGGLVHAGCRVQAIELELGSLRSAVPEQRALFDSRPAVGKAVEDVHRRYPGLIRRPSVAPHAVFEDERGSLDPF